MRDGYFSLILILALALTCFYSYNYHDKIYPSIYAVLSSPSEYQNKLVEFRGGEVLNYNPSDKSFDYNLGNAAINVKYSDDNDIGISNFGRTSIIGTVKEEHIELLGLRNHNYNYMKYFVSVAGFVIFGFYFFREWRIKNFRLEERGHG